LQWLLAFVWQAESQGRLVDVVEHLAEEPLVGLFVQRLARCGQHVAKRHRRRQLRRLAGQVRLDFAAHDVQRCVVHDHVVEHQQRHPLPASATGVHQLHQRCLAQVQAVVMRVETRAQPGQRIVALDVDGVTHKGRLAPDHLHRLVEVFPMQRGAQDVVALDHPLQGLGEGFEVCLAGKAQLHLGQVRIAVGGRQVLVEHALLQRCQRVDVLHVGGAAGHAGNDAVDGLLVELHQRQHVGGDAQRRAEPVVIVLGEHFQQGRLVP